METLINTITKAEQRIAANSLEILAIASDDMAVSREKGIEILIQETGVLITVPKKALQLLFSIIQNMAEGQPVSLVPSNTELSTQQAADMLHVSRPHFVKLLEKGEMPFKKIGSHRRVLLKDLVAYETKLVAEREKQLDFLSKQAQDLNLGYE
ncbi:MAG: excisionase family DNA binding protein [Flammeovirgaceae bacterium]|jgi:excisionase family DNA binding protein